MKTLTAEQITDKIIRELQDAGFTPEEMIKVIRLARKKYNALKTKKTLIN